MTVEVVMLHAKRSSRVMHAVVVALLASSVPQHAAAQCTDPAKHFRGGIWKQWILWTAPGPAAQEAVQRIIAEVDGARASVGLPELAFDPSAPLIVSAFEENNPRGPDGLNLSDRTPNRELFVATSVGVATGGSLVLFLTDPLRSNTTLTDKGVPGTTADVARVIASSIGDTGGGVFTAWTFTTATDRIAFSVAYPESAISARSRFPIATLTSNAYLGCNVAKSLDTLYRSMPTQTLGLLERNQAAILNLPNPLVSVTLAGHHHDPEIDAMLNDPGNTPTVLWEMDRVVRFEHE